MVILREKAPAQGQGTRRVLRAAALALERYGLSVALVMGLLGLWQGLTDALDVADWLLPSPWEVLRALADSWGLIMRHAWVTLREILIGFALALGGGVYAGTLIVSFRSVERAVYPLVVASQTVPVIAIAPILVIWFGFGLLPKIIVIALVAFFPVVVNTVDGLRSADPDLLNLARSLGATRWRILAKVQFPAALPMLLTGAKIAAVVSVIGAVLGEWVGASEGLAYLMSRSIAQFLTARVFAAVLVLSVMGVALFYAVVLAERWLTPWRQREERERVLRAQQR